MKKYLLAAALCLTFFTNSFAQISFSHSLGLGVYMHSSEEGSIGGYAAVYSPRLNLLELGDNANISLGTHFGLGFSGGASYNSRSGLSDESGGGFILDFPIVAELNVGHACNNDNDNAIGFFLGGGFDYNKMAYVSAFGEDESSTTGLLVNGGVRFALIERSWELRGGYLVPFGEGKKGVLALTIATTFGMDLNLVMSYGL